MGRLRSCRLAAVVVCCALLFGVAGCKKAPEPTLDPKVAPPVIAEEGTLRAGVDLAYPPFAGVDGDRQAGIDIDVAAALADKLGLKVTFVDVSPSQAATALADGTVDIMLSVPLTSADLTRIIPAGTYLADGPAAFISVEGTGSVEPTMTIGSLPTSQIAAQTESEAFWLVNSEYGAEAMNPFESLRAAFTSVESGESRVAVGSAVIGAYIARDFERICFAGQLAPATPLTVAVAAENTELADAVRLALDELAADGVLDSVRRKWVENLPALTVRDLADEDDSQ